MKYGLIGKTLKHSFSKIIHESLDSHPYDLLELNEEEVIELLKRRDFLGINVTIPYKKFVIQYLDEIDDLAKEIGAVNTIVNKNGRLIGYNTDYYGLKYLIEINNIEIKDKNIYILGTGGTKNTALKVVKDLHAKNVSIVSRHKTDSTITYEEFNLKKNVDVIINTTPIGMFPNNEDELIDITNFPSLSGYVDVIYNPLKTNTVIKCESKGINAIGGLQMLIEQAIVASELFLNTSYPNDIRNKIYSKILKDQQNIVLIGLPFSGKTTIGKELHKKTNKQFIDLDEEIEKFTNKTIPQIFNEDGEEEFRRIELEVTKKYSKQNNLIISTGGGIIKNPLNMLLLKQNGIIVHISRDFDNIVDDGTRPLVKSKNDFMKLANERNPIYKKYQDYEIINNSSIDECINKFMEVIK